MHRNTRGRLGLLTLLAVVLLTAGSCKTRTSDRDLSFVDAVQAEQLVGENPALLGLKTHVGVFIDPRTQRAFDKEHIPGAVHLPFSNVAAEHTRLRKYRTLVVYGSDFNDDLAFAMSKRLIELGHKDVKTLRGGLRAWRDAGNETATGG